MKRHIFRSFPLSDSANKVPVALAALLLAGLACGPSRPPTPIGDQVMDEGGIAEVTTGSALNPTTTFTPIPVTPTNTLTASPLPPTPTFRPTNTFQPFEGDGSAGIPANTAIPGVTNTPIPTNTQPIRPTDTPTGLPTAARTPSSGDDDDDSTSYVITTPNAPGSGGGKSGEGSDITPDSSGNRLDNPSFSGATRGVIFGEINVFEDWEPFYCDQPYTSSRCPIPRPCPPGQTQRCNPPELFMGRPEFKPTNLAARVRSGTAQQWFCFFRTCRAGVFQTFDTQAGQKCEVAAYVQSWSNFDSDPESDGLDTEDGRDNSQWFIKVDPTGGTNAFGSNVIVSRAFTHDDGHYDKYVKIRMTFTAQGNRATVFFENLRIWPIENNDNYIDDAYAHCR